MSVRFDASGEMYTSTAGTPGTGDFTALSWFKIVAQRAAYSTPWGLDNGSNHVITPQCDNPGTDPVSFYIWVDAAGTAQDINSVIDVSSGVWYALAVQREGTTLRAWIQPAGGSVTPVSRTINSGLNMSTMRIGRSVTTAEWINGRIANYKLYTAALTLTEIQAEWNNWQAQRTAGLTHHHKFQSAAETTDYSGAGNALTVTGAPIYESDNPTIDDSPPGGGGGGTPVALDLTYVGNGGWANGAASPSPAWPAGLQSGDKCYAICHSRESTVVLPSTVGVWTKVEEVVIGSGTVAADTGPTRMTVYETTAVGTETGTVTLSSLGTTMVQAIIHAFRAPSGFTDVTWLRAFASYSHASSTNIGGTSGAIAIAAKDQIIVAHGSPSDTTTSLPLTSIAQTGTTFGTITSAGTLLTTATGNDGAAVSYQIPVTAGSGSGGVTLAGTANTARTGGSIVLRARATGIDPSAGTDTKRFFLAAA